MEELNLTSDLKIEAIKAVYSALNVRFPEDHDTYLFSVLSGMWETATTTVDVEWARQEGWQDGYDAAREEYEWDASNC